MKDVVIAAMQQDWPSAERLSYAMNVAAAPINEESFPDRESKVRVMQAGRVTILYCSLYHPNEKLIPLIFAASALRDLGAETIILVAPYLCYMRQDKAFHEGEAVSQRVLVKLLSPWIDQIVTVEPHLHRVKYLKTVFPDIRSTSISASSLLASLIENDGAIGDVLLVGPDEEARSWTKAVADKAQVPYIVLEKTRLGDRDVRIDLANEETLRGKRVYLIDDIVSSGATLAASARLLRQHGVMQIDALTVHTLCSTEDLQEVRAAGVSSLKSTDTVPHETNAVSITQLLAETLVKELNQ